MFYLRLNSIETCSPDKQIKRRIKDLWAASLTKDFSCDQIVNCPKICRNYPFTENFPTRKLDGKSCILRDISHFVYA